MKYILTALLFLAAGMGLLAQTTILSEDFNEGFPVGWQLVDNDGLTPNESPGVNFIDEAFVVIEDYDSTGIGDSILVATSWFDEAGEADDWLILPNLTMGSYGNYVSFDARSIDASHPDGLEIRVSTGGVNLWEFFSLDTVVYANVAMNSEWTNYTLSLDSLDIANQNVFIAFRHISTDNYILALDNIEVRIDDPVGIEEESKTFQVYPNPSQSGYFQFDGDFTGNYNVFDISGKQVLNKTVVGNTFDLSGLQSGIYIIKAENHLPLQVVIE